MFSRTLVSLSLLLGLCAPSGAQVEICLGLLDAAFLPTTVLDGDGCGFVDCENFYIVLDSTDTTNLGTYSQRIIYDSNVIRYHPDVYNNDLSSGFGKDPGTLVVEYMGYDIGVGSHIDASCSGISGQTGPQRLATFGFDVVCAPTSNSVTVQDNPNSTAPYADCYPIPQNIPHTHCSPVPFTTINGGECLPTPTVTPTSTPTEADNVYWDDQLTLPGPDGPVYAFFAGGPGNVYIGGDFTAVGGVPASNIAKWNGSTWSALGTGVNDNVYALALSWSGLYAGGAFTTAGGEYAWGTARWNGTTWWPVGSAGGCVFALAVRLLDVYAGGVYLTGGGVPDADYIAKWNGIEWSALGTGMNDEVHALAVSGSDLYAGGVFTTAGGVSANSIAKWDGSTWSALGAGMSGGLPTRVSALAVMGSDVYAAGDFTTAGGGTVNHIAQWDGATWSALGTGVNGIVRALAVSGSNVYAGGEFTTAGGGTVNHIAQWDGATWSALGTGVNGDVCALAVSGDAVFAGGNFTTASGKASPYLALWQPRVNVSTLSLAGNPGDATLGDDLYGFYKPALITDPGTTVSYTGGLPVDVTMRRAPEIHVSGNRINGAFTLTPEGVSFGGTGATLRVEFSEDDVALFGGAHTDFRVMRLIYPPDYPASKEAVGIEPMSDNTAVPWRIENGRQIYKIEIPFTEIGSTYGAVPEALVMDTPTSTPSVTATPRPPAGIRSGRWKVYR